MNKTSFRLFMVCVHIMMSTAVYSQTDWGRVLSGTIKAGQAMYINDEDLAKIVAGQVAEMDKHNKVCDVTNDYSKRLEKITNGLNDAEGIKLNFKVYLTKEYNAFACPDGSVRVYSALMDILSDDELLGVIGHEIGHVALRHSKKAWRSALLRSAVSDAIASRSRTWASLSDSQLGSITSLALSSKHSRYHETQADEYGYTFLKRCNKNPWAMGLALAKLKKMSHQKDNSKYAKLLETFSSHPNFDERIEHIKQLAKRDYYKTN